MKPTSGFMDLGFVSWPSSQSNLPVCDSDDVRVRSSYFYFSTKTFRRPEILRMSELSDNSELQMYSTAVLYALSAVSAPREYIAVVLENFATAIKSSKVRMSVPPLHGSNNDLAVMANTVECVTGYGCVFLPKSVVHLPRWNSTGDGCSSGMPRRRQCGSSRNGFEGFCWSCEVFTAPKHCATEGNSYIHFQCETTNIFIEPVHEIDTESQPTS